MVGKGYLDEIGNWHDNLCSALQWHGSRLNILTNTRFEEVQHFRYIFQPNSIFKWFLVNFIKWMAKYLIDMKLNQLNKGKNSSSFFNKNCSQMQTNLRIINHKLIFIYLIKVLWLRWFGFHKMSLKAILTYLLTFGILKSIKITNLKNMQIFYNIVHFF